MSNQPKREFRVIAQQFQVDTTNGAPRISGYAARFNEPSHVLADEKRRVFNEVIAPGAFTKILSTSPDIQALVDHDPAKILGRTSAGTLSLSQDDKGLAFTCDLPDTSYGRDLAVSMARGDIRGCSFGMYCKQDEWSKPDAKGVQLRTLKDIAVFEVTITPNPAYPTTTAQLRSMFPDGLPKDVKEHRELDPEAIADEDECSCNCDECEDDDCENCSHDDCACVGCDCTNDEPEYLSQDEHQRLQLLLDLASL